MTFVHKGDNPPPFSPHPSQEGSQYHVKGNRYPIPPQKVHIKVQSFNFRPNLISMLHIVCIKLEPGRPCVCVWIWDFEFRIGPLRGLRTTLETCLRL